MSDFDRPTNIGGFHLPTVRRMATAVAVPRLEFHVVREAGSPCDRRVTLEGERIRVGSHLSNELVLVDHAVSRFHCSFARSESAWTISDSGSLNGTYVSGLRIREVDLPRIGCELHLGDSIVRVRESADSGVEQIPETPSFGELYGESAIMRQVFGMLERAANSDATVLLEGESGTGKELAATELYHRGPRAHAPFLVVDCSSISPSVIESELFGHAKGAFTGADRQRVGAFEAATGGTIFLDEIGEMPLDMQPKLLRALEAKEIRRVGENEARRINVRVIAATNRNLEREVNRGRFREDLYFRLSVVAIRIPPLRKRIEDLDILIRALLQTLNAHEAEHLFNESVRAEMAKHDWPGNVRELRNYVERAIVMDVAGPASQRRQSTLPPDMTAQQLVQGTLANIEVPFKSGKEQLTAEYEKAYLKELMTWAEGNVSKAARKAQLDRMYLHRLLQRHDLKDA
ncbi:MAG: sigma 54-interacting transcriptional regulator [Polyangiaceae bacterium]